MYDSIQLSSWRMSTKIYHLDFQYAFRLKEFVLSCFKFGLRGCCGKDRSRGLREALIMVYYYINYRSCVLI